MLKHLFLGVAVACLVWIPLRAEDKVEVKKETWDYTITIKEISKNFKGSVGKVVPLGDSISYANQAGRWVRFGAGRTPEQIALARWMHAQENDKTNGWWLAADDQPNNRSWTAASGITSGQYLAGGFNGMPALDVILKDHAPQIALILLGTNDLSAKVPCAKYLENMESIYKKCIEVGAVPVACTILPTTWGSKDDFNAYNEGLFKLAEKLKIPFLDLKGEFLKVRPGDTWRETLISKDGAHPTSKASGGPANDENLKNDGYLLKCFLQVNKVGEIKEKMKW
jgi:lysophospholipase L1-like esterase